MNMICERMLNPQSSAVATAIVTVEAPGLDGTGRLG